MKSLFSDITFTFCCLGKFYAKTDLVYSIFTFCDLYSVSVGALGIFIWGARAQGVWRTEVPQWGPGRSPGRGRPLSRIFQKIRLAEPYFRLISGSAEFLRKLRNSAENAPEHHKFGQQDKQIETIKVKIQAAQQRSLTF